MATSAINKVDQQIKLCVQVLLDTSSVLRQEWTSVEEQKKRNSEVAQANEVEAQRLLAERRALEALRDQLEGTSKRLPQEKEFEKANQPVTRGKENEKPTSQITNTPINATPKPIKPNSIMTPPPSQSRNSRAVKGAPEMDLQQLLELIKPIFVELLDLCNYIDSNTQEARHQGRGLPEDVSLEILQRLLAIKKNLEGTTRGLSAGVTDFVDNKFGGIAKDFGNVVKLALTGEFEDLVGRVKKLQRVPRQLLQLIKEVYEEGNGLQLNGNGTPLSRTYLQSTSSLDPETPTKTSEERNRTSVKKRRPSARKMVVANPSENASPSLYQYTPQHQPQENMKSSQAANESQSSGSYLEDKSPLTTGSAPAKRNAIAVTHSLNRQQPKTQPQPQQPQPNQSAQKRKHSKSTTDPPPRVMFADDLKSPTVRASMPNGSLKPLHIPGGGVLAGINGINGSGSALVNESTSNGAMTWRCNTCDTENKFSHYCVSCGARGGNSLGSSSAPASSSNIQPVSGPSTANAGNGFARPPLQKSLSSPSTSRVMLTKPATPSAAAQSPAAAPAQWRCFKCHNINRQVELVCVKCATPKPSNISGSAGGGVEWQCSQCTVLNKESQASCVLCGTRAPEVNLGGSHGAAKVISNNNNNTRDAAIPNQSKSTQWKCPMCEIHNPLTTLECEICCTQKPANPLLV